MDDSRYDLIPAGPPTLRYHTLCRSHPQTPLTLVVGDRGDMCGLDTLDVTAIRWYGQKKCNSLDAVCECGGEAVPRRFSVTNLHSNHHVQIGNKRAREDDVDEEEGNGMDPSHDVGGTVSSNVVPGRRRRGPKPCIAMLVTPTTTTTSKGGEVYNIRPIEDILRVYRKHDSVEGDSNLSNAWALSINTIESRAGYTTSKGEGVEGVELEPASIGDKLNARQEAAARARAEFLEIASARATQPTSTTTSKPSAVTKKVVTVAVAPSPSPAATLPTPSAASESTPSVPSPSALVSEHPTTIAPPVDTYVSEAIAQLIVTGGDVPPNPPITTTTAVLKVLVKGHPKVKQLQAAKDREGLAALLDELRKLIVSELLGHKCVLNGSTIQYPCHN